jgi:hypothetical protein
VKVSMMLADAAQAVNGKLYILGGGWSVIYGAAPAAIALKIEVPWNEAGDTHTLRVELLDADGRPVLGPDGERPLVKIDGTFKTGVPAGLKPGLPVDAVQAFGIPPLPLEPGRYVWKLSIDGREREDWSLAFTRAERSAGS